jgi:hypothetical protein
MGNSYAEAIVEGPGSVSFTWSVSSEENPDYDISTSPNYREIYDAFYFFIDGSREAWISGEVGPEELQFDVPAGKHRLKWEYSKDPYTEEGDDAGFLSAVEWTPNERPFITGSYLLEEPYRFAGWWGSFTADHMPWSWHVEHGWLYMIAAADDDFWVYSLTSGLEWLYVDPAIYPVLYSTGRTGWLFYTLGSAVSGAGGWFYDYNLKEYFQVP